MRIQTMKNEFQEVEVIESNLLDPTKPTDYAEPILFSNIDMIYDIVKQFNIKPFIYKP